MWRRARAHDDGRRQLNEIPNATAGIPIPWIVAMMAAAIVTLFGAYNLAQTRAIRRAERSLDGELENRRELQDATQRTVTATHDALVMLSDAWRRESDNAQRFREEIVRRHDLLLDGVKRSEAAANVAATAATAAAVSAADAKRIVEGGRH